MLRHLHECALGMRYGIPGVEGERRLEHLKGLLMPFCMSLRQ
jgi:hypothetical protein